MWTVTGADGTQIARYKNRSEIQTFLDASYPPHTHTHDGDLDSGRIEVQDHTGQVVAVVQGPPAQRPANPSPTDDQRG